MLILEDIAIWGSSLRGIKKLYKGDEVYAVSGSLLQYVFSIHSGVCKDVLSVVLYLFLLFVLCFVLSNSIRYAPLLGPVLMTLVWPLGV